METMDEIYRQHADMVFRYLMSLCGNENIAREITQETFYQAILSIGNFNGQSKVSTWLCSIARNKLLEYHRKHPATELLDENYATSKDGEAILMNQYTKIEIMKAIHRLPQAAKEVVQLRLFGDLSFKEIGEVMEKSENWARVTYYRAKTTLRKELEELL